MRRDVLGLGVAMAVGGLAYGSNRVAMPIPIPGVAVSNAAVVARSSSRPRLDARDFASLRLRRRAEDPHAITAHVREAAVRHGVPESLVAAVISVESEFNPRAVSRRGALGLMQLMPDTAALLGVRDAFNPGENVDAGARHLRDLLDRFANDVSLALAAYNAGAQAVIRHGGVPPYPETRAFVSRVLRRVGQVAAPAAAVAPAARPTPAPRIRLTPVASRPLLRGDGDTVHVSIVDVPSTPIEPTAAPRPQVSVAVDPPPPPPAPARPDPPAALMAPPARVEAP
jgi:hypothetical protein